MGCFLGETPKKKRKKKGSRSESQMKGPQYIHISMHIPLRNNGTGCLDCQVSFLPLSLPLSVFVRLSAFFLFPLIYIFSTTRPSVSCFCASPPRAPAALQQPASSSRRGGRGR